MMNKWEGIVLRTMPYGETNKIVTILTKEAGKLTAMARGAKKPASRLSSITQLFVYGSFYYALVKGWGPLNKASPLILCAILEKT